MFHQAVRTTLVIMTLAGVVVLEAPALAETREIPIPEDLLAQALSSAIGASEIHLDNFGRRRGTSWLEDESYLELPDGTREEFSIPEYTFEVTRFRRIRYYVNDLNSSTIQASIDGSRIALEIGFESEGEEIQARCIVRRARRWRECSLDIERDVHLNDSVLTVRVRPVAYNGSISFADPIAAFETDVRIPNRLCRLFSGICEAIERTIDQKLTEKIQNEVESRLDRAPVKAAVAAAVREAPGVRDLLDPSWRVTQVESSGSNFIVTVERPDQVDADSVESLFLTPVQEQVTGTCPLTVRFLATVDVDEAVHGTGYLAFESGGRSPSFSWSAGEGRTLTSEVSRTFVGAAGQLHSGWAEMVLGWQGTDGRKFTKTSNRAEFDVHCTAAFGTTFTAGTGSGSIFASTSFDAAAGQDDEALGLRFGLGITETVSFELGASFQSFEVTAPQLDSGPPSGALVGGDFLTLDLHAVYRRPIRDRWSWQVFGGAGWRFADAEGTGGGTPDVEESLPSSTFAPAAGLGLVWSPGCRWFVDGRILQRWFDDDGPDAWTTQLQLGIGTRF